MEMVANIGPTRNYSRGGDSSRAFKNKFEGAELRLILKLGNILEDFFNE